MDNPPLTQQTIFEGVVYPVGATNYPSALLYESPGQIALLAGETGGINGSLISGVSTVKKVVGRNGTSLSLYLMLFDSLTLPANGTVPNMVCFVGYGPSTFPTEGTSDLNGDFVSFTTGVYYAWSTTDNALTVLTTSGTGLIVEVWG